MVKKEKLSWEVGWVYTLYPTQPTFFPTTSWNFPNFSQLFPTSNFMDSFYLDRQKDTNHIFLSWILEQKFQEGGAGG